MKDRYAFIALLSQDEDGISISFPDLEGCYPSASSMDEALKNAKEAMALHLWIMEQDNEEIPEPTPFSEIIFKKNEIPALIDVFMPPIREKINTRFIKKTLSLPAWLAAKAEEDGVNYSKLLQKALIEYLGVDRAN